LLRKWRIRNSPFCHEPFHLKLFQQKLKNGLTISSSGPQKTAAAEEYVGRTQFEYSKTEQKGDKYNDDMI